MTARKLIEFADGEYRIVHVHAGFSVLEKAEGQDWLGVERWRCARYSEYTKANFHRVTVGTETVDMVRLDWALELLNQLGDAMMREKKRGRGKRGGK